MSESRVPRVFHAGDPEPLDMDLFLRDCMGDVWHRGDDLWFTAETVPMGWERITKKYAPLTEVLPAPAEAPRLIRAPWDAETVSALNDFQVRGGMHPFTCGREHFTPGEAVLVATADGWVCPRRPACGYTQDWAHAFMADRSAWPQSPFAASAVSPETAAPAEPEDMTDDEVQRSLIGFLPFRVTGDARTWLTACFVGAAQQGWDVDTCSRKATELLETWKALPGAALPVASVDAGEANTVSAPVETGETNTGRSDDLRALLIQALNSRPDITAIDVPEIGVVLGSTTVILLAETIGRELEEAGWRPPLPRPRPEGDLNELLGIDDVVKRFTEAEIIDSYAHGYDTARRERGNETVQWGYRRVGEPDDLIRKATAMEAQAAIQRDGFEVVYRTVGPWKVDED